MKILIIEDEKPLARTLKSQLNSLGYKNIYLAHSVESAIPFLTANPDISLIFSDIQLGDGLSFEIFDSIDFQPFIIFTTAYEEYSLRAFQHHSLDYLLKPIQTEDLQKSLEKFSRLQPQKEIDFSEMMNQFRNRNVYKSHFLVQLGNQYHSVPTSDIKVFYSEFKTTYLISEKKYVVDETLSQLEKLIDPYFFFRINRQYIINRNCIDSIKSYRNSRLQISIQSIEEPLIISRERVSDFKKWLDY